MRTRCFLAVVVVTVGICLACQATPADAQQSTTRPGQSTAQGAPRPGMPPRDTAVPIAGTARIRGTVVAADTGAPLRRAVVRLNARELREGRTTTTDAQGRYEVKELPAGRYTLNVSKGGYVSLQYGQERAFEQGRPLEVRDGQSLDAVNFALPRGSVIAGRIVDEFGEPVAEAMVTALRYQYVRGQRRLFPAGRFVQTDDLGQYRLYGLPPGDYYVSGTLRSMSFGEDTSGSTEGYAPTYYPGTPSPGDAQRVTVALSQEAVADFALVPARLVRVTGSVIDSTGKPATGGFVRLSQRSEGQGAFMMFGGSGGRVRDDGSFTLTGVAPGTYTLVVSSSEGGPRRNNADAEWASVPVTVGNDDLTGLLVTTSRGTTVVGQVVFEGAPASFSPTSLRVFTTPADPDDMEMGMGGGGTGSVKEDWTFELVGVFGRRLVTVGGGPGGRQGGPAPSVKAVYLRGQDITDTGFEATGQRLGGLQVVLTSQTTELTGTATDGRGDPVRDYFAVVFAEDSAKWTHPLGRYTRSARPDQDGKYSIAGLPPGEYLAVAVPYLESGAASDPELLERLRSEATPVRLGDGEKKVLNLKMTDQ